MIETWVTALKGVCGIPLRFRVIYIVTILYQVDRLTIGHAVLVNQVTCGVMDNVIMLHQTGNLRTKDLSTVPVGRVGTWVSTTEDNLVNTWHFPSVTLSIEDT